MMTIATQAARRPSDTSASSAPMTSSLSASGSMSLPKVVIDWRRRASQPSTASVIEATANTMAASRSPFGVWSSSATTSTGTSRMRRTVRTFGTLIGNIAVNGTGRHAARTQLQLRLQTPSRDDDPRAPRHGTRGERRGYPERQADRDVARPEEPVPNSVDEVEERGGVREIGPGGG